MLNELKLLVNNRDYDGLKKLLSQESSTRERRNSL